MRIAFFETAVWQKDYLRKRLGKSFLKSAKFYDYPLWPGASLPDSSFEMICVFTSSVINKEIIAKLPNLRYVAARSTGFDHIDLKACGERGIKVANVPTYGEVTVAEYAFALLLSLSRKICQANIRVRQGVNFNSDGLTGIDLIGKTIGVIGTGHIGKHAIRIAQGIGMKVQAFNPHPDRKYAKKIKYQYVTMERLLRTSDVVTIHVPYMPVTHHLINKKNIKFMKRGAILINTSRGGIVETSALLSALKSGQLSGAGLDVLEFENATRDNFTAVLRNIYRGRDQKGVNQNRILIGMPNVVVTPHNAFNSKEALERILDTTIGNIKGFVKNKPINLVKQ